MSNITVVYCIVSIAIPSAHTPFKAGDTVGWGVVGRGGGGWGGGGWGGWRGEGGLVGGGGLDGGWGGGLDGRRAGGVMKTLDQLFVIGSGQRAITASTQRSMCSAAIEIM